MWHVVSMIDTSTVESEGGMFSAGGCCAVAIVGQLSLGV